MAPKVKTRADFPKGPEGTKAFKNYKLSKLYRTIKGKKIAKNVLKIGSRSKLLGKGLLASQMYKTGKDALKPFQKGPDGKRRGIAGVIERASQNTSKKDKEMRDKGFVKNKRGRYVKKKVVKQKSTINKVDAKQFDSRKTKTEKKKETPKYKQVTQKELDAKVSEKKKKPKFGSVNLKASDGKNKEKLKVKPKKMHAIEKRNRERFGDAHVDKLKKQYADFKARRKKKKKN